MLVGGAVVSCSKKVVDDWRRLPRIGSKQMLSEHIMDIVNKNPVSCYLLIVGKHPDSRL